MPPIRAIMPSGHARLELVWPNKEKFLLSPRDANGKPVWVERTHPAASEVRPANFTEAMGDVGDEPQADNLLFTGDRLDVLRILHDVPGFRRHYPEARSGSSSLTRPSRRGRRFSTMATGWITPHGGSVIKVRALRLRVTL